MKWYPIETAPKDGTIVRLRDKDCIYNCVMEFDTKHNLWVGMAYSAFGASRTYWDEEFCKIHEWSNVN